ncbi:unnamed protein product [Phytophthora fragariaefolia]|uniref:Unnamed protein product n=1 Tax=Phytophthora fragariaefolia TaxID=1490495 RepID=A0A9W6YBV9_9STRA|nr:unnamed protein product [Phytophthora fragariaefolia]
MFFTYLDTGTRALTTQCKHQIYNSSQRAPQTVWAKHNGNWSATMKISDLLAPQSTDPSEDAPTRSAIVPHSSTCATPVAPQCQRIFRATIPRTEHRAAGSVVGAAGVVPDKKRKHRSRLSVTQKLNKLIHQDYESKVFNLTLDINQLKQQVQHLNECRDLYLTRLFLSRQHLEGEVLQVVDTLVNGFSKKGPSLTSTQQSRLFSNQLMVSGSGVHELVLERGTHIFSHRSWETTTTQVVHFVEEDDVATDVAELRRLCGGGNGCVVETIGVFTGRIKRAMIAAFYPHVLCDEALVAQLIGYSITCPVRLVFYFDEQRCITHQVAQVDVLASMKPLQRARPADFAVLMTQHE